MINKVAFWILFNMYYFKMMQDELTFDKKYNVEKNNALNLSFPFNIATT